MNWGCAPGRIIYPRNYKGDKYLCVKEGKYPFVIWLTAIVLIGDVFLCILICNVCFILRNARKKEIVKAYRKAAQIWHPDKFESEEEKKKAEKVFMDIAAAKEVLTNPGRLIIQYHG